MDEPRRRADGAAAGIQDSRAHRQLPLAAIGDPVRKFYGVQFHPEVAHTPQGGRVLENFLFRLARLTPGWTMASFVDEAVGPAAPLGTRKLYEDKDLGVVVLAHCNHKPHKSPPHDHGA